MRILVISDLPQFVTGGVEMQASRLVEAWLDAGHEVRCLGRRMGPGPVRVGRHEVAVARIGTIQRFGRPMRAASYFASLTWRLWRLRRWADVVYVRFLGEAAVTAALLKAAGLLRVALVATPANTRGAGDASVLRALPFTATLVRLLDRRCDAINLIAGDMDAELRDIGFSGANFTRIPNGIPIGPAPARAPVVVPRLVVVGRLATQKGLDLLLQALAPLRSRLQAGQLAIVGDGPERVRLQALAQALQLGDRVAWLGELPQADIARLLGQAQVFVLPSRYEGLSNAGLEALERGLPVLATACGGLDRYLGPECGWVVPAGDVGALRCALEQVLDTPPDALARMGREARALAEQHFDMAKVGAEYLALFERLAEPRARG